MTKIKSIIFALSLMSYSFSALSMQQNQPIEPIAPHASAATEHRSVINPHDWIASVLPTPLVQVPSNNGNRMRIMGWFESWFPRTFTDAETALNTAKELTDEVKKANENGVIIKTDPQMIHELNKAGTSFVKTCLTAGIGGALALSGVILLYKTLNQNHDDQKEDTRPLYKQIVTNRYLLSAALIASGLGIIIKSDKIVAAVS